MIGVGDDVLELGCREPNLGDGAVEGLVRIGIDGEGRRVALRYAADIGLVDLRFDADAAKVLCDLEQFRCLQAGGHGLALVDGA